MLASEVGLLHNNVDIHQLILLQILLILPVNFEVALYSFGKTNQKTQKSNIYNINKVIKQTEIFIISSAE